MADGLALQGVGRLQLVGVSVVQALLHALLEGKHARQPAGREIS